MSDTKEIVPVYGIPADVLRKNAFAIPYGNPSYPPPPDPFYDRSALAISYRSDIDAVRALVPEPLLVEDPIVTLTFLFMVAPGLGDYFEVSQAIVCDLEGEKVSYRPQMYAGNIPAMLTGREIWGLPKKYGHPNLQVMEDTLVGTLEYSGTTVARATMGYKFLPGDKEQARKSLSLPTVVLKIIPHVDGTPRILELVRIDYEDLVVKEVYTGPGALELFPHALAPLAATPVREIVNVVHTITDVTLPYGRVVRDYLK